MKISMASTKDVPCGIAVYTKDLIGELEKHAEVELVSLDPGASALDVAEGLNRGDVAHIQFQYPFFGGMALHRNWFRRVVGKVRVPVVVTIHELDTGEGNPWPLRRYKSWFNRCLFGVPGIARIIVHTEEYRELLLRPGMADAGPKSENVVVIPEGVPDIPEADIRAENAKSDIGLEGRKVFTVFGFVVRRKGYETALRALEYLPEEVSLLIAGGPHPGDRTGYFEGLKERISAEGLEDRVVVTGYLPEERIPLVMAATDVIVAPFTAMSNSASIVLSLAYGKPIVASDLPATREINARTTCLRLFPVGDAEALGQAVRELLESPEKRSRAVAGANSYVREWSISRAAAEHLAVYESLLR